MRLKCKNDTAIISYNANTVKHIFDLNNMVNPPCFFPCTIRIQKIGFYVSRYEFPKEKIPDPFGDFFIQILFPHQFLKYLYQRVLRPHAQLFPVAIVDFPMPHAQKTYTLFQNPHFQIQKNFSSRARRLQD